MALCAGSYNMSMVQEGLIVALDPLDWGRTYLQQTQG